MKKIDTPIVQTVHLGNLKEQIKSCLVIGGGIGYLGHKLAVTLFENDCPVRVLSFELSKEAHPPIKSFQGDIQNYEDIIHACEGVDTVFHAASIILPIGFVSQAERKHMHDVNVIGTHNVIKACLECKVSRLVYTSTDTVVFTGEIFNGDESLPYAKNFIDVYTETKMLAEKAVLEANGHSGLLTCSLRPGGIYGPGNKTMLCRFVDALKRGHLVSTIGTRKSLADRVYVDNLVHAHLLAAVNLLPGSPCRRTSLFY